MATDTDAATHIQAPSEESSVPKSGVGVMVELFFAIKGAPTPFPMEYGHYWHFPPLM